MQANIKPNDYDFDLQPVFRFSMIFKWQAHKTYSTGTLLKAENRLYEVMSTVTSEALYPFTTYWFENFSYGGGTLRCVGAVWEAKKWYMQGAYCISNGNTYQLERHSGITSGTLPVASNPYCIDGDICWKHIGENNIWTAETDMSGEQYINADNRIYEIIGTQGGSGEIPADADQSYPIRPV